MAWHSCRASAATVAGGSPMAVSVSGMITGLTAPVAKGPVHGPAHPDPEYRLQPPFPSGTRRTACPATKCSPQRRKPFPEVTMTSLPLFSVSTTAMSVASWVGVSAVGVLPE